MKAVVMLRTKGKDLRPRYSLGLGCLVDGLLLYFQFIFIIKRSIGKTRHPRRSRGPI